MKNKGYWHSYLVGVITGEQTGFFASFCRIILSLLEFVYKGLLKLSYLVRAHHRLPIPVISIGNIVVGGTGKTPAVVWLAKLLMDAGYTPAVITRGYRGQYQKQGLFIRNQDLSRYNAAEIGDEPFLLARFLPETFIVVGRERYRNGLKALAMAPEIDVFILDDGFQHWGVERNLDIVLLDATKPFSNDHLIPRGFLREPAASLKRAGIILLTRTAQIPEAALHELQCKIRAINPAATIGTVKEEHSDLLPLKVKNPDVSKIAAGEILSGRKISAITGIGNPRQFLGSLEKLGAEVGYFKAYPDHYNWQADEIQNLIKVLADNGFHELIVTAKDGVKLEPFTKYFTDDQISCYILSLEFRIADPQIIARIKASLQKG